MKYTKELAEKLLELLPEDIICITCDKEGVVCGWTKKPDIDYEYGQWKDDDNVFYVMGEYESNENWENSLVSRQWPKYGDTVYIAEPMFDDYYQEAEYNDYFDIDFSNARKRGLIFKTKEEAIKKAKKMLELS